MKFYLAGKWSEKKLMSQCVNELEAKGHTCTHKWMLHEGDTKAECALNDIRGVTEADFLVVMITDKNYPYRGTFTELGAALATKKSIYLIDLFPDSYASTNCFYHHPNITHLRSFQEVWNYL